MLLPQGKLEQNRPAVNAPAACVAKPQQGGRLRPKGRRPERTVDAEPALSVGGDDRCTRGSSPPPHP